MTRLVSAIPPVTTDLDTVDRRAASEQSQLELLVSAGATPSGPSGALVGTPFGEVQVDVLQVTDADVNDLPDDPTGRLHIRSHAWAASTATGLVLAVEELPSPTVAVAELLDIVRLTLDGGSTRPRIDRSRGSGRARRPRHRTR